MSKQTDTGGSTESEGTNNQNNKKGRADTARRENNQSISRDIEVLEKLRDQQRLRGQKKKRINRD